MRMRALCPYCRTEYQITDSLLGRQVNCKNPDCGRTFVVTADPGVAGSLPDTQVPAPHGAEDVAPPPLATAPGGPAPVTPPSVWPAAGMPAETPLPAAPPVHAKAGPKTADELLAGYRSVAKPVGPSLMERLKGGFVSLRKRGRVACLKYRLKGLESASEGQLENLGTLTLTHRPAEIDLTAEIAEMSTIQDFLTKQQATVDSLRQTKGSSSVTRDLQRQMAQQRDRQRQIMIGIGKKAAANRPEMPGAVGGYSALDHLTASIQANRNELEALETELGPIFEGKDFSLQSVIRPALIAGGTAAVLVVFYLVYTLVSALFSGGTVPSWALPCTPGDAQSVGYLNVDRLRKTEFFKDFEKQITDEVKQELHGLRLGPEDVREVVFAAGRDNNAETVIFRTRDDVLLEDLVPRSHRSKPKAYKKGEYVRVAPNAFLTRTTNRTYCITPSEKAMEEVLDRLDREDTPKLDKDLQRALASVSHGEHYMATVNLGSMPMPFGDASESPFGGASIDSVGTAFWLGSALTVDGIVGCRNESDGEKFVRAFENVLKMLEGFVGMGLGEKEVKKVMDLAHRIKLKQKGKSVYFSGSWKVSELQEIAKTKK